MSAKFNTPAAFAAALSRVSTLVTTVKHTVGDASSVSVPSHVLHNTHYVVSAHLKSIIIDISETRLINYARCYVVLWLISYLRKNDLHAKLVLQLLTGDRQKTCLNFSTLQENLPICCDRASTSNKFWFWVNEIHQPFKIQWLPDYTRTSCFNITNPRVWSKFCVPFRLHHELIGFSVEANCPL